MTSITIIRSGSRLGLAAAVAAASLGLAACNSHADDATEKQADAVEQASDNAADAMHDQADQMTGAAADAMDQKAEAVEHEGKATAAALDQKADEQAAQNPH
ncbi:hypothetical protein EDF56_105446 [Novosphingobium sp. PhB165]|uniref:hypothetical protein n=1 Tax=Novosphingobium sp. PhB165 TaxID=2485105 RepID=UPI0010525ABA|nr:hypothetical protein [Novosphingobium sp. PhB165]TCM18096.1 hypothetical protein EDF56_105446 [Novosphingobium sp. PhB165]